MINNFIKKIISFFFKPYLFLILPFYKYPNRVFIFHSIDKKFEFDHYGFNVDLKNFINFVEIIINSDFKFNCSFNKKSNAKSITITFDDGYSSIINAIEYLETLNIPYIIFIITSKIGEKDYLTKDELIKLSNSKLCTLGSHSHSHYDCSKLNYSELFNDFKISINILEQITNKKIYDFSFPFGKYNTMSVNILRNLGIKNIFTSTYGFNSTFDNLINRIEIIASDNSNNFKKKLNGEYDFLYLKKYFS